MKQTQITRKLRAGSALQAVVLAGLGVIATPAFAQTTAPAPQTTAAPQDATQDQGTGQDIVVTGSMLATPTIPSPVTTLTVQDLDRRGISTVQDGEGGDRKSVV